MPKRLTDVQVTKDETKYIINADGALYDDHPIINPHIIVKDEVRFRLHPLVKYERYKIECIMEGTRRYFFYYCDFTGEPAEFRLAKPEPHESNQAT